MMLELAIEPTAIRWSATCELPDGRSDNDAVITPARGRTGFIEVTHPGGYFGADARPCQLGIREKFLTWKLEEGGMLRLTDFSGTVRTFIRPAMAAAPGAVPCNVTPKRADLRLGERALFRVSAPGFDAPTVRSELRYVGDTSGGRLIQTNPLHRTLDAIDVVNGEVRIVRGYDVKEMHLAVSEDSFYIRDYPGGVIETVVLTQGGRHAACEYRVRLVPPSKEDQTASR